MRQEYLDLEVRIAVAQQALPFAHSRPKGQIGAQNTNGKSSPQVNDKIGPRVEVRKVNADNVDGLSANIMPLDFLLRVMRDSCAPSLTRCGYRGAVCSCKGRVAPRRRRSSGNEGRRRALWVRCVSC